MTIIWMSLTAPKSFGLPCFDSSQFRDIKALTQKIAIIGTDDRTNRDGSNVNLEAAQGRIYCFDRALKSDTPSKIQLLGAKHHIANAVLAFNSDVAIVNRHLFLNETGKQKLKFENCYFEHIASGEIVAITDAEWPPHPGNLTDEGHQDVAVIRLKRAPSGGKPIAKENIILYKNTDVSKEITIISNYAWNKQNHEALTTTSCHRKGFYSLISGVASNMWGTDCDTGEGSSGAQAYVEYDGGLKLFGIVTGEKKLVPEGGDFDPKKLATMITQFDESLFDAYERIKKRTPL